MSFVGVLLGAIAGVMLAPHIVTRAFLAGKLFHRTVPDPGTGGDR